MNEFYQEDIKNGTPKDELPTWYNYEYGLTTYFSEGKEGILNFIAETFEYTGGAHPNSWNKWMNFEKNTGKLLALKDVFMAGSEKPMSDMLLEKLITEMATRLEDSSITSLEGLQNAGILNSTNMYVPDNFLLEKEKVSFLYNKYDIAPYAVGIITLSFTLHIGRKIYDTLNNDFKYRMELILKYFPNLSEQQKTQFAALYDLYTDWNSKINVISRKDITNLYEHHVLHSLGIAKVINFTPDTQIMDLGTGGGFPGIPLAILFPEVQFHLVDSIGKKVKVATEIANAIGLKNVTFRHCRAEEEKRKFDFVVSRAVMPLGDLIKIIRKNIRQEQHNALPNGLICLKGGELDQETMPVKHKTMLYDLKNEFTEDFFKTKKVVYVTING